MVFYGRYDDVDVSEILDMIEEQEKARGEMDAFYDSLFNDYVAFRANEEDAGEAAVAATLRF